MAGHGTATIFVTHKNVVLAHAELHKTAGQWGTSLTVDEKPYLLRVIRDGDALSIEMADA